MFVRIKRSRVGSKYDRGCKIIEGNDDEQNNGEPSQKGKGLLCTNNNNEG